MKNLFEKGLKKPPGIRDVLYKIARAYPAMAAGTALTCAMEICAGYYRTSSDLQAAMGAAAAQEAERLIARFGKDDAAVAPSRQAVQMVVAHWAIPKNEVRASELIMHFRRQITTAPAGQPSLKTSTTQTNGNKL